MLWSGRNLSVTYRQDDGTETPALRDVSHDIAAAEQLAIVGANGSGKSTLALLLVGLIRPTSGAILLNHRPAEGPTGAIVFQNPDDNLIGATVYEELRLALEHTTPPEELDDAVAATLARFDLAHLTHRPTERLSGGEKQSVAVACAFATGQPLIILDEPTSHLDPPGRRLFWEFLDQLQHTSGTPPAMVVVTQYPREAERFSRVVELHEGQVRYDGLTTGWRRPKGATATPHPPSPTPNGKLILSVRSLNQRESPGWPLPENPIRDISLDIRAGERIALCGPIGSGKTTLAFLLAGLLKGKADEFQHPDNPPVALIQFPERQMFCDTVLEEVAYGLHARGIPHETAESRAREALRLVGLPPEEFESRNPFSLSGGQKRRVMLAVAAALDAPLYILDEPQAALDEEGMHSLGDICDEWHRCGKAYLIISHDLDFLRMLTSRVLILNRGCLTCDGTWTDLVSNPKPLEDIGFIDP